MIIVVISLMKIWNAVFFILGDARAGNWLIYLFYPVRLIVFYNPFAQKSYNLSPIAQKANEFSSNTYGNEIDNSKCDIEYATLLRCCYEELKMYFILAAAVYLITSSHRYAPSILLK